MEESPWELQFCRVDILESSAGLGRPSARLLARPSQSSLLDLPPHGLSLFVLMKEIGGNHLQPDLGFGRRCKFTYARCLCGIVFFNCFFRWFIWSAGLIWNVFTHLYTSVMRKTLARRRRRKFPRWAKIVPLPTKIHKLRPSLFKPPPDAWLE